jgi:hypothetical protein
MSRLAFALLPFPGGPALPFRVGGSVSRQEGRLTLAYELTGEVASVAWPAPSPAPERRDRLWQQTCCECFLARPGDAGYWEANLSPAGHWQLYRFDDYRQGLRTETAIAAPAIVTEQDAAASRLSATLDLGSLLAPAQSLLLGVTLVVCTVDGATSYWALAHPGERPDFHHRAAFRLTL